jgi:hypothetical protein
LKGDDTYGLDSAGSIGAIGARSGTDQLACSSQLERFPHGHHVVPSRPIRATARSTAFVYERLNGALFPPGPLFILTTVLGGGANEPALRVDKLARKFLAALILA